MYQHDVFFQSPSQIGRIHNGLVSLVQHTSYTRLMAAVAYVTERGCVVLHKSLSQYPHWHTMKKEWLISLDFGLTEPSALEFLQKLPHSSVRIANAESVLRANLHPKNHFHYKTYIFEQEIPDGVIGLFSGSANLTFGGLYINAEQATSSLWIPPLLPIEQQSYTNLMIQKTLLNTEFEQGTLLDSALLSDYERLWSKNKSREKEYLDNETRIFNAITAQSPVTTNVKEAVDFATARCFWIQVGKVVQNRGQNKPGNQIDMKRGTRVFFGFSPETVTKNTVLGSVKIKYEDIVSICSMRFGDNSMDKITLPIPRSVNPIRYDHQYLLFERNSDGSFSLSIGNESQIREWKTNSVSQGMLFSLNGGREFGLFS